jgi:hypothetical protein
MNRSLSRSFTLIAGLVAGAPLLAADGQSVQVAASRDRGLLDDRFTVSLGTFLMSTDTTLSLDGTAGQVGTEVNLERDLGLSSGDRFRVDANWRIAEKHHIRALYFDYGGSRTKAIERELEIGDTTYPVNATLEAGVSTTIYELAYEYAFMQRDNWDLLASFGAHIADFGFHVSGNGTVGGQPVNARTESSSVTAPLPVLGLRYAWRFAPKWYLEAQAQYFAVSIDNVDGQILDMRAGVNWMFTEHVGIGAGWNRFSTDVDISKDRFQGSLDWSYSGAQVYVTASF